MRDKRSLGENGNKQLNIRNICTVCTVNSEVAICTVLCNVHLYTAMYSYPAVDKLYCISTVYCNVLLSCSGYTGTVKCIHLAM